MQHSKDDALRGSPLNDSRFRSNCRDDPLRRRCDIVVCSHRGTSCMLFHKDHVEQR